MSEAKKMLIEAIKEEMYRPEASLDYTAGLFRALELIEGILP